MKIAAPLSAWQRAEGRHGLPWQLTQDPYRVWLSEIMLQQTQVTAVLPYYQKFLTRFPEVASLANAPTQEVMAYWAGLGYYARARNLHACAQRVMQDWNGSFPPDAANLATLPGIGPSTAAAIAAFCYGERAAILDGNVKRVLARYFAIDGDPSTRLVEQTLWQLARSELPTVTQVQRDPMMMTAYTQGLMDLGATSCKRSRPACTQCPLKKGCTAYALGRVEELPWPRAKKKLPERSIGMLIACHRGKVLLQQRPDTGIWGGLWSLPEFNASLSAQEGCNQLGISASKIQQLSAFLHVFTHYRLTIAPILAVASSLKMTMQEESIAIQTEWVPLAQLSNRGMPAPVRKLLDGLLAAHLLD
jgi:A/G-specific adenine glycosylase